MLCSRSGNAFGVSYQKPSVSSSELNSSGAPAPAGAELKGRVSPSAARAHPPGAAALQLYPGSISPAMRRCSATGRCLKSMSTPVAKHVFKRVLGGKTRSEYSREYLFPLGLCVLLVVYFMDRVGPICLGEGVWLSNALTVSVLRSHCLGTLVLTFKCIFQIQ